jgi:hypothetical protein
MLNGLGAAIGKWLTRLRCRAGAKAGAVTGPARPGQRWCGVLAAVMLVVLTGINAWGLFLPYMSY